MLKQKYFVIRQARSGNGARKKNIVAKPYNFSISIILPSMRMAPLS